MYRKAQSIFLFTLFVQSLSCSDKINPTNPNGYMRLLVRKLVYDRFMENPGTYVFYWDGKNDSGKYFQDGLYRCVMTYVGYEREFFFNVKSGGKEDENNKAKFEYDSTLPTELIGVYPNPCKVKSGANVELSLREPGRLTLLIYFDQAGGG
ncbi:MAG: hypothetical protein GWP06_12220 [Actinobacteria bacterium]|nr:hypothetical protein [Actinomycetota bacterium]